MTDNQKTIISNAIEYRVENKILHKIVPTAIEEQKTINYNDLCCMRCGKHAEIILKYEADGTLLLCETCDDNFEKYKSYWANEAEIQKCIKQQAQWESRQEYLVKLRNKLIADWLLNKEPNAENLREKAVK